MSSNNRHGESDMARTYRVISVVCMGPHGPQGIKKISQATKNAKQLGPVFKVCCEPGTVKETGQAWKFNGDKGSATHAPFCLGIHERLGGFGGDTEGALKRETSLDNTS